MSETTRAIDIVLSESFEPNRLTDAEAVCRRYGWLLHLRQQGAPSEEQIAAASEVTLAYERWQRRWGEA